MTGVQTCALPIWEDRGQSVIAVPRGGSGQLHPGCEVGNWGWQGEGACMGFFGEVMVACRGFQRGELIGGGDFILCGEVIGSGDLTAKGDFIL